MGNYRYIGMLIVSAASIPLMSTGSFAADQDVNIDTTIAAATVITGDPVVNSTPAGTTVSTNGFTTTVNFDIDAGSGTLNDGVLQASIPVRCNASCSATITSTSGGLKVAAFDGITPDAAFQGRIDYTATLAITDPLTFKAFTTNGTNGATATTATLSLGSPFIGNFVVNVDIEDNAGEIIVAGSYTDTLTFSVDPN